MGKKRELLVRVDGRDPRQCKWAYFRASGPGGQHRNKTETGARVTHLPSGAVAQASEHKSKEQNKKAAFKRLGEDPKFRAWLKTECARKNGELARIEREVNEAMRPHNLKIERRNEEGRWEVWQHTSPDWNDS